MSKSQTIEQRLNGLAVDLLDRQGLYEEEVNTVDEAKLSLESLFEYVLGDMPDPSQRQRLDEVMGKEGNEQ